MLCSPASDLERTVLLCGCSPLSIGSTDSRQWLSDSLFITMHSSHHVQMSLTRRDDQLVRQALHLSIRMCLCNPLLGRDEDSSLHLFSVSPGSNSPGSDCVRSNVSLVLPSRSHQRTPSITVSTLVLDLQQSH
mmetsp:Transcript_3858/g.4382  ORF Transcript_3858/g.4382 Transcript_3858/m.4382 type:complete len:133 (-) Transcript_3858:30-428(-)